MRSTTAPAAPTPAPDAPSAERVRVACVGDSITRGTFVWRRRTRSYPAQLQALLGDRYHVRGFGVNGHAAQREADRPYWRSRTFRDSGAFLPHIVLVMLGTNDSRGDNWRGVESFARDYRDLALHYLSLSSRPHVWLMTPPALFARAWDGKVNYEMDPRALQAIREAVVDVAHELGCGLIDVHAATAGHPEAFRFDGVHPGGAGATLIARTVFDALSAADPQDLTPLRGGPE